MKQWHLFYPTRSTSETLKQYTQEAPTALEAVETRLSESACGFDGSGPIYAIDAGGNPWGALPSCAEIHAFTATKQNGYEVVETVPVVYLSDLVTQFAIIEPYGHSAKFLDVVTADTPQEALSKAYGVVADKSYLVWPLASNRTLANPSGRRIVFTTRAKRGWKVTPV